MENKVMFTSRMREYFNTPLDFSHLTGADINKLAINIKELYIETYDQVAALIQTPEQINFANAVQPFINLKISLQGIKSICTFTKSIHTNKEVRQASTDAATLIDEIIIESEQREDVYKVLRHYEMNFYLQEQNTLHPEENSYFEDMMLEYRRNGMQFDDIEKKNKIKELKQKISQLCIDYCHNLDEVNISFTFTIKELEGLPADWFNEEKKVSDDIYKVTLKYDDLFAIMDYAKNRELRKKMQIAFESRCADTNTSILKEIIQLRSELAQILGYATHADYVAEMRMVRSASAVHEFLQDMNSKFTPLLNKNLLELTQFAREYENDPEFILNIYDMRYYMRLHEEKICNINMEEIKKYFPQSKVINGTFAIYENLLGLKFIEMSNDYKWHPDIKYYDVYDVSANNEKLGGFYLDLHPREGKYAHAAAFSLQDGCDIEHITGKGSSRQTIIAAMVCNFPRNENLPFDDVVTFFHEFGHVMHFICCKTKLLDHASGYTEIDFLEAPSQMLENWCYEPAALKLLSAHVDTQEPLPEHIALQLKEKEKIHAGYLYKRQLNFGFFDFYSYRLSRDELLNTDLNLQANNLRSEILQLPNIDTCYPASFEHMVDGYDAGYYGYLYSLCMANDMYETIFKKDPLSSENGMRYRKCILEPGASKDGMEMIENFLGRKPTIDAFLRSVGLSEKSNPKKRNFGLFNVDSSVKEEDAKRVKEADEEEFRPKVA